MGTYQRIELSSYVMFSLLQDTVCTHYGHAEKMHSTQKG